MSLSTFTISDFWGSDFSTSEPLLVKLNTLVNAINSETTTIRSAAPDIADLPENGDTMQWIHETTNVVSLSWNKADAILTAPLGTGV